MLNIKQNLKSPFLIIGIGLTAFVCFILFCFFQVQNGNKTDGILNEDEMPEPTNVSTLEETARKKGGKYVAPEPTETLPLRILKGEENSVAPAPIDEVIIDEPTTLGEPAESADVPPLDESMIPEQTNIPPLE